MKRKVFSLAHGLLVGSDCPHLCPSAFPRRLGRVQGELGASASRAILMRPYPRSSLPRRDDHRVRQ
jgi:hypothetical protein